jgi:hypothetical protein
MAMYLYSADKDFKPPRGLCRMTESTYEDDDKAWSRLSDWKSASVQRTVSW